MAPYFRLLTAPFDIQALTVANAWDCVKEGSLHVLIALAEGIPEDAVKAQPRTGQDILPAPEQDPYSRPQVPALLQHVGMHIRMRLHNGVRPGAPPLYSLKSHGIESVKQMQEAQTSVGVGRCVKRSICKITGSNVFSA